MSVRGALPSLAAISVLAAWLGASLLATTVVAPAAFAVLPTRTLAGALVGRVLPALFWSGLAIGGAIALLAQQVAAGRAGIGATVLLAAVCAIAQLGVAPRIAALRTAIGGPVDALDAADAQRIAFGRLHGLSVLLLGMGMIAALAALVILTRHLSSRRIE